MDTSTPVTENTTGNEREKGTGAGHDRPARVGSVWHTDRWAYGYLCTCRLQCETTKSRVSF